MPTSSNSSVMVGEIICEFMQVSSFASLGNFTPNSEDDRTFEIPPSVKLVMERIVGDIEIKYGKKNPATKVKFVGRIKKPHLTWKQRADIIYFMLHPGFANKDVNLTSEVFEIPPSTLRTWLKENRFYGKWVPFAKNFQPNKVQRTIPESTGKVWMDIPAEHFSVYYNHSSHCFDC